MTDRAGFADAEWELLVRLPRWVVTAASAAQPDHALATAAEQEVGLVTVAQGRASANALVARLAAAATDGYDAAGADRPAGAAAGGTAGGPATVAAVLDQARAAAAVLAKAALDDAAAYRQWLLGIADAVIGAARSGGVLGIGADRVTESERQFREELTQALG
ncbi:MAG TPA: hypothetical protein VF163_08090 [Micromonosporaceae bacterium]